jgi:gas vesicle protein
MTRKHFIMYFIVFDIVVAGALCGHICHKYQIGDGWEFLVGGVLALVSMFVGMILAFMVSDDRERHKRMRAEHNYRLKMQEFVVNKCSACSKVMTNKAKTMADFVSNRIVSKVSDGMDEDKRNALIAEAKSIVAFEVEQMTRAMFAEIEKIGNEP